MLQQRIHFRVETPLFLGGFNPFLSEWRVASLKGCLRYWYRAIQPDLTMEKKIFGITGKQSLVIFHIDANKPKISRDLHRFPRYFTFFLKGKSYIKPGEKFTLHLLLHPKEKNLLRDVLTSIWLLTTIGGLGSRCRRGFGTISIHKIENQQAEMDFLFEKAKSISAWKKQVQKGLQQCWQWYPPSNRITHPMVHPTLKMFVYQTSCSTWEKALRKGAYVLERFRQHHRRNKSVLRMMGTAEVRCPSITWFRIVHINGQYYPVYFVLPNDFPEPDYQQFVQLWGGFLVNNRFEASEFNE